MAKFDFISETLRELKEKGLYVNIRRLESAQGAWIVVNGKKVLNMCSNNYLGFANDERLKKAAVEAIEKYGVGPGAVRPIVGNLELYEVLEERIARFKGVEAALVLQGGFITNFALIPSLATPEDVIFSDELNHASIIDGCRISKAKIVRYPHCDANALEDLIRRHGNEGKKKIIVTDGVFSMDGDLAPLPELVDIAERYDAILIVDDAHGEGVLGGGKGIAHHFGLVGKVDIETGTLSKAFGVFGGYIAGRKEVIEFLKQRARPFLFGTGMGVGDIAAAIKAIEILEESDEPVRKLWENAKYFKEEMRRLGFDTGKSQTPITPVMIYDEKKAQEFSRRLFEEGVFAQAIVYPTVPLGKARIRVMISAIHTKRDLDFALERFAKIGRQLGVI